MVIMGGAVLYRGRGQPQSFRKTLVSNTIQDTGLFFRIHESSAVAQDQLPNPERR